MNLAKLGLILDSKGRISRPEKCIADYLSENSSTAADYGFEVSDQFLTALGLSSPLSSTGPSLLRTARATTPIVARGHLSETPATFRRRAKEELGLVDIDEPINLMNLRTLRHHFGYKNGKIKLGIFARNVVWQIYRFTQAGSPPEFVLKGCNVRSFRYHVKKITETYTVSFGKKTDFHKLFGQAFSALTGAGILSYRDLNVIDNNRIDRWVAPPYGAKNVVFMAEKKSFSEEIFRIGKKHGVTVQASGGMASRTTVETMLLEMADVGHDLTAPFVLFAVVDYDPSGWNIARAFVQQMLELGLGRIRSFWPYGRQRPRQPWIDVVSLSSLDPEIVEQQRHPLSSGERKRKLTDDWIQATGGLYGRGGKTWALSSEAFLGCLEEHFLKKSHPHLPKDSAYPRITAFDTLDRPLKNYIAARLAAR